MKLLFFILAFNSNMVDFEFLKEVTVKNPSGDVIDFYLISKSESEKLIHQFNGVNVKELNIDPAERKIYLLENLKVIHCYFMDGKCHIFNSLMDFKMFYDLNSSKGVGISYNEFLDYEYYYFYSLKPFFIKEFMKKNTITKNISSTYFTENKIVYEFENKCVLEVNEKLNKAKWFEKLDFYNRYNVDIYSDSLPLEEDEADKVIILEKETRRVVKVISPAMASKYKEYIKEELFEKELPEKLNWKAFLLKDGKVLSGTDKEVFLVFSNKTDFLNFISVESTSNEFAYNFFTDAANINSFLKYYSSSKESLSKLLGIDIAKLDYSIESFRLIDQEVNKFYFNNLFRNTLSLPLIGYFGESLILTKRGEWNVKYIEERKYWEPFVVNENGTTFKFLINVFDQLNEKGASKFCSLCVFLPLSSKE
jgi:hypothetical protein